MYVEHLFRQNIFNTLIILFKDRLHRLLVQDVDGFREIKSMNENLHLINYSCVGSIVNE